MVTQNLQFLPIKQKAANTFFYLKSITIAANKIVHLANIFSTNLFDHVIVYGSVKQTKTNILQAHTLYYLF